MKEIEAEFEAVYAALKPYETNKWPGFVLYAELTKADTRKLAQVIDTLAENCRAFRPRSPRGKPNRARPAGRTPSLEGSWDQAGR